MTKYTQFEIGTRRILIPVTNEVGAKRVLIPVMNEGVLDDVPGRMKILRNKLIEKRRQDRVKEYLSSIVYMQNNVAVAVTRLQGGSSSAILGGGQPASTPGSEEESNTVVMTSRLPVEMLALSNTRVRPIVGTMLNSIK